MSQRLVRFAKMLKITLGGPVTNRVETRYFQETMSQSAA